MRPFVFAIAAAVVLAAVPVVAMVTADAAWAEAPADAGTPTVTIINKAPDAPEAPATPELTVSPAAAAEAAPPARASEPDRADSPAAPARPPAPGPAAIAAPPLQSEPPIGSEAGTSSRADDTIAGEAAETAPAEIEPTLSIDIDLSSQAMTVSERGVTIATWPISSARFGYRTPTGSFKPTWMSKMWYSRQYDYAPMPHAIFFHKGVAIHATYALSMLGRPASHGCVRLAPKNAAYLFKLVSAHGKEHVRIFVHGTPVHTSPRIAGDGYSGSTIRRYRYLPPGHAQRGYANYGAAYAAPRTRRGYMAPRRPPRGLYSGGSYGYGF